MPIDRLATVTATCFIVTASAALAQPEPPFCAACGELPAAITRLDASGAALITIEVDGLLRDARSDGALAYLLMCAPPDPLVLCVTYSTGGRKAGDRAVLTGNFTHARPRSRAARSLPAGADWPVARP
jgi:hypothetical protein